MKTTTNRETTERTDIFCTSQNLQRVCPDCCENLIYSILFYWLMGEWDTYITMVPSPFEHCPANCKTGGNNPKGIRKRVK